MAPTFSRELIQVLSRTTGAGAPSPQDIEREIARRVLFRDLYDKLSKGCKMLSVKLLCIVPTEEEIANVVEEARTFHDSVLADFNHLNSLPTASHLAADLQVNVEKLEALVEDVSGILRDLRLLGKTLLEEHLQRYGERLADIVRQSRTELKRLTGGKESSMSTGDKPRIFIGSSVEGLEIARAIQAELGHDYHAEIWNQSDVWGLGTSTIEALEDAVNTYDAGIFVFTPDDELHTRGTVKAVARDNVLFELGLFIGKLTRFGAFVVHPRGGAIVLPSDLSGVTVATYDPALPTAQAAVGSACERVRRAMKKLMN